MEVVVARFGDQRFRTLHPPEERTRRTGTLKSAGSEGRERVLKPDTITGGGSAGGVEVLKEVVAGLPEDLNAALFVVVHIGGGIKGRSWLPEILTAAGRLRATHASDGEPIQKTDLRGRTGLSPMLERDCVRLVYGPRQDLTRRRSIRFSGQPPQLYGLA